MAFFTGDFKIRVGDVDPKEWILRQGINNDPIDLTNATDIEIRLQSLLTGTETIFSKSSNPTQVFIVGDPVNGIIRFIPLSTDFANKERFSFYIAVIDSAGSHSIPEGFEYALEVSPKFGS